MLLSQIEGVGDKESRSTNLSVTSAMFRTELPAGRDEVQRYLT